MLWGCFLLHMGWGHLLLLLFFVWIFFKALWLEILYSLLVVIKSYTFVCAWSIAGLWKGRSLNSWHIAEFYPIVFFSILCIPYHSHIKRPHPYRFLSAHSLLHQSLAGQRFHVLLVVTHEHLHKLHTSENTILYRLVFNSIQYRGRQHPSE